MTVPPIPTSTSTAPKTLTLEEALESARRIRPLVIEQAPETEIRGFHSPELHDEFLAAGFYHLLRPRMFGGYEFSLEDFMRVMREIAQGDLATAWCLTLASAHNLQMASWWPEQAQREFFAGPYFAAPMTGAPSGTLVRTDGGFIANGDHPYASGVPYSTHFSGHAMLDGAPTTFVVPRADIEILDDWGRTMGLRGSGSHTVRLRDVFVPAHYVLEGVTQVNKDVSGGTPGLELHGNPLYVGRGTGFFGIELASLTVGALAGALDEYAELMLTRRTIRPPIVIRREDDRYLSWYGEAVAKHRSAVASVDEASRMFAEACQAQADGTGVFDRKADLLINMVARNGLEAAWDVMQKILFHSAGSSAATTGQRLERIYRDVSMAWGHLGTIGYAWSTIEYARLSLGELAVERGIDPAP